MKPASQGRPYLHELDRLRVVTALSVIAVHVFGMTMFLDKTPFAFEAQNAFVSIFHFTREVFMFVTAFALVYVYYGKPFSWKHFWKRRGIGVVLPYTFWTFVYFWVNDYLLSTNRPGSPLSIVQGLAWDLLTGNASYQLYYILLTIQFYLLFPLFMAFLRRVERHPWLVLGVSFVLEFGILYALQSNLQARFLPGQVASWVDQFKDSFVLTYQFFFILGGMVALYLENVRAFLLRHSKLVAGSMVVALAALAIHYVFATRIQHESVTTAAGVLQPVMVLYGTAVIFFFYWIAYRQVSRASRPTSLRWQRIWHNLSDAAFGMYLVHPLILGALVGLVMLAFMSWPAVVLLVLFWALTAAGSIASSLLLLRTPVLSRLVGRERKTPQKPSLEGKSTIESVRGLNDRLAGYLLIWRAMKPAFALPTKADAGATPLHPLEVDNKKETLAGKEANT
jgi:peptidoglycan/LPS O-acetylase OafA/YrhL